MTMKRCIKTVVQYDGTNYSGFQRQRNALTVQEVLEDSLSSCLKHKVRVRASGRTDAGVHARGQVISFTTTSPIPADRIGLALLGTLPQDIIVGEGEEVPPDFDPMRDANSRTYCYRVWRGAQRDFMMSRYSYHYSGGLDLQALEDEAKDIIGERDFAGFMAKGSPVKGTTRCVFDARWVERDWMGEQALLEFWISGDGFLYKMVRLLAGTMIDVARGRLPQGTTAAVLGSLGKVPPGPCLPGKGLCLEHVSFS